MSHLRCSFVTKLSAASWSTVNVKSYGSPSEPVLVSVQSISIPLPSTNLTSLLVSIVTSVPSPSSKTNPAPIPSAPLAFDSQVKIPAEVDCNILLEAGGAAGNV